MSATCARCGEPIGDADKFCESCGASVAATAAPEADGAAAPVADAGAELGTQLLKPPSSEPVVPVRHCPSCGGEVDADGWCTVCGLRAPSERDHFTEQPGPNVAAVCDRGKEHPRNEDAVALAEVGDRLVLAVCDGVTTTTDSDVAALAAAQAARDALQAAPAAPTDAAARQTFWQAQFTVAAQAAQDAAAASAAAEKLGNVANPPSCTFVSAIVDGPIVASAWIGDSRSYWFGDDGTATQLSVDDSWASGEIAQGVTREVAEADPRAHSITRWLGIDSPGGDPSFTAIHPAEPGWVLVCTDGFWNYRSDATQLRDLVLDHLANANNDPLNAAGTLVDWANEQGGHDNITVALARACVTTDVATATRST